MRWSPASTAVQVALSKSLTPFETATTAPAGSTSIRSTLPSRAGNCSPTSIVSPAARGTAYQSSSAGQTPREVQVPSVSGVAAVLTSLSSKVSSTQAGAQGVSWRSMS